MILQKRFSLGLIPKFEISTDSFCWHLFDVTWASWALRPPPSVVGGGSGGKKHDSKFVSVRRQGYSSTSNPNKQIKYYRAEKD